MLAPEPEPPPTPIVSLTPQPPPDRRRPIAVAAGLFAIVGAAGLGVGFEGRAIARDEAQLWSTASSTHGTEEDWQRYVDFAGALRRGGGLRQLLATELTAVATRAPLAEENVLVARAESAIARHDEQTLCTIAREHPDTRGGARATVLLRAILDIRASRYDTRARESGLEGEALEVLHRAMLAVREDDPCTARGVLHFTRAVSADEDLARHLPGSSTSVGDVLEADDPTQRADAWTTAISGELASAAGVTLTSEDDPQAHLVVEVETTLRAEGRALVASGAPLPGLALDGTVRFFVRPLRGTRSSEPDRRVSFHVAPASSHALEFAQATGETELRALYADLVAELERGMIVRVRHELGLAQGTLSAAGAGDCADALPLPIGRVVHGDTRHRFDDGNGSCSMEHADAESWDDCDECWDEERDPPSNPEAIYRLALTERRRVAIQADADDARPLVVYVRESCLDDASEIACDEGAPIDEVLEPGLYFVFVDETGGGAGRFDLVVTLHDPDRAPTACASAIALTSGVAVHGDTRRGEDALDSHCGGVGGNEAVHAIEVSEPSRVRCRVEADFAANLDVRDDCRAETPALVCAGVGGLLRAQVDAGRHLVVVDGNTSGATGTYTLACDTAPIGGQNAVPADDCATAGTIGAGSFEVDTMRARDDLRASCGGTEGADLVYRLDVATRSHLHAVAAGSGTTVLSLRTRCDEQGSELACGSANVLDADLAAGTHWLVVDGAPDAFGARTLTVALTDLAAACASAIPLPLGPSAGTTRGTSSLFSGTCVSAGPEAIERLVVPARSHVVIRSQQWFEGGIYVRRDCADWHTELACNAADGARRDHALVDLTLDAGTYYVFVDGERAGQAGTYTLDVETTAL